MELSPPFIQVNGSVSSFILNQNSILSTFCVIGILVHLVILPFVTLYFILLLECVCGGGALYPLVYLFGVLLLN